MAEEEQQLVEDIAFDVEFMGADNKALDEITAKLASDLEQRTGLPSEAVTFHPDYIAEVTLTQGEEKGQSKTGSGATVEEALTDAAGDDKFDAANVIITGKVNAKVPYHFVDVAASEVYSEGVQDKLVSDIAQRTDVLAENFGGRVVREPDAVIYRVIPSRERYKAGEVPDTIPGKFMISGRWAKSTESIEDAYGQANTKKTKPTKTVVAQVVYRTKVYGSEDYRPAEISDVAKDAPETYESKTAPKAEPAKPQAVPDAGKPKENYDPPKPVAEPAPSSGYKGRKRKPSKRPRRVASAATVAGAGASVAVPNPRDAQPVSSGRISRGGGPAGQGMYQEANKPYMF